jgi:hypothetical protein
MNQPPGPPDPPEPAQTPEPDPHRNVWLPPPPGSPATGPTAQVPQPAAGPPPRFTRGAIVGGAGAALGIMVLSGLLSATAVTMTGGAFGGVLALLLAALAFSPLIVGIVLASAAERPRLRGFGLGLAIGWALWLIVGAGVCVAVVVAISARG